MIQGAQVYEEDASEDTILLAGKTSTRIQLFMNDVHYYLANFRPNYDCAMYISGCDFYPIPGKYVLPCGEGSYTLSALPDFRGQICMMTQGNSVPYVHDYISVPDQTFRIDFGWSAMFQKIHIWASTDTKSMFTPVYVPKVVELKSV